MILRCWILVPFCHRSIYDKHKNFNILLSKMTLRWGSTMPTGREEACALVDLAGRWLSVRIKIGWKGKRIYFLLSDHLTPKHGVQEEDVPNQCKLLLKSVSYILIQTYTLPCLQINLVDILKIDPDRRTVRCEPLVTMGQLTDTLDRFSLWQAKSLKVLFFTKAGLDNSHCAWVGRLDSGRTCYGHRNRDE